MGETLSKRKGIESSVVRREEMGRSQRGEKEGERRKGSMTWEGVIERVRDEGEREKGGQVECMREAKER